MSQIVFIVCSAVLMAMVWLTAVVYPKNDVEFAVYIALRVSLVIIPLTSHEFMDDFAIESVLGFLSLSTAWGALFLRRYLEERERKKK